MLATSHTTSTDPFSSVKVKASRTIAGLSGLVGPNAGKRTRLTSGRRNGYRLLSRIGIAAATRVQLPQLLLVLHPSILEPGFHLGLGQV